MSDFDLALAYLKYVKEKKETQRMLKENGEEEKPKPIQKAKFYCPSCGEYTTFELIQEYTFDGSLYRRWRCLSCLLRGFSPYTFLEKVEGGEKNERCEVG